MMKKLQGIQQKITSLYMAGCTQTDLDGMSSGGVELELGIK